MLLVKEKTLASLRLGVRKRKHAKQRKKQHDFTKFDCFRLEGKLD